MIKLLAGPVTLAAAAALLLAPTAQADDYMYRVGTDISPGDYTYKVVGSDWGSWQLCSNAQCSLESGLDDMDMIDGAGHTGYFSVPAGTKFVKISNLQLQPM